MPDIRPEAVDAALAEIKRIMEDLTEGEIEHLRVDDETPQRCVVRRSISAAFEAEGLTVETRRDLPKEKPEFPAEQRLVGPWREVEEQDEPIHDEGLRIENKNSWGGR